VFEAHILLSLNPYNPIPPTSTHPYALTEI
jgi:hypothetical protein